MAPLARLALVRRERAGGPVGERARGSLTRRGPSDAFKTPRVYADFVVDGRSLSDVVQRKADLISDLGWGPQGYQEAVVARLLFQAPGDLPTGRNSLFVCPECADLGCGRVGAMIERVEDHITWRDFVYENGREPPTNQFLETLGPFTFDWTQYESVIRSGLGLGGFE